MDSSDYNSLHTAYNLERIDYPWLKIPVKKSLASIIAARAPNMVVEAPKIKRKTSQIIK